MIDHKLIKTALYCGCPQCGDGSIFPHRFTLDVTKKCRGCALNISDHDSGDGPAVFLIFILGFLLTPMALIVDHCFSIPLWLHAILWSFIAIIFCLITMQPLKAYVIGLNYKHRNGAHGV